MRIPVKIIGGLIASIALSAPVGAQAADPTCSGTLDIAVHGQHIVGDYVTGIGHAELGWPPQRVSSAKRSAAQEPQCREAQGPASTSRTASPRALRSACFSPRRRARTSGRDAYSR